MTGSYEASGVAPGTQAEQLRCAQVAILRDARHTLTAAQTEGQTRFYATNWPRGSDHVEVTNLLQPNKPMLQHEVRIDAKGLPRVTSRPGKILKTIVPEDVLQAPQVLVQIGSDFTATIPLDNFGGAFLVNEGRHQFWYSLGAPEAPAAEEVPKNERVTRMGRMVRKLGRAVVRESRGEVRKK